MKKDIAPAFIAITFAAGGLWGLSNHIDYSGWLLVVAIIVGLTHGWGESK